MTDRYVVFGNPVAQSKSPAIHAAFAKQVGHDIDYQRMLAPLDGFTACVTGFIAAGGCGANVTLPFKGEAFAIATSLSPRARAAAAVNTLRFDRQGEGIFGDNTDGAGLLADIQENLGFSIAGKRVLLVGAGGAARGVILPLLDAQPASLAISNRTIERAQILAAQFATTATLPVFSFSALAGQRFDLVINATAASLADTAPPLPAGLYADSSLAYDMVYGRGDKNGHTTFMQAAHAQGAAQVADGLGMLVEQAAESFLVWRGVRPQSAPVLAEMRALLTAP